MNYSSKIMIALLVLSAGNAQAMRRVGKGRQYVKPQTYTRTYRAPQSVGMWQRLQNWWSGKDVEQTQQLRQAGQIVETPEYKQPVARTQVKGSFRPSVKGLMGESVRGYATMKGDIDTRTPEEREVDIKAQTEKFKQLTKQYTNIFNKLSFDQQMDIYNLLELYDLKKEPIKRKLIKSPFGEEFFIDHFYKEEGLASKEIKEKLYAYLEQNIPEFKRNNFPDLSVQDMSLYDLFYPERRPDLAARYGAMGFAALVSGIATGMTATVFGFDPMIGLMGSMTGSFAAGLESISSGRLLRDVPQYWKTIMKRELFKDLSKHEWAMDEVDQLLNDIEELKESSKGEMSVHIVGDIRNLKIEESKKLSKLKHQSLVKRILKYVSNDSYTFEHWGIIVSYKEFLDGSQHELSFKLGTDLASLLKAKKRIMQIENLARKWGLVD